MKLIISFSILFTLNLLGANFKIVTEHFPPYQIYKNNTLTGISVDLIQEIQTRLQTNYPIEVLAWNDAYQKTLKNKDYIIFSIGRTIDREKEFQWVGPINQIKYIFFKNSNNKIKIRNLSDAKAVDTILVSKNDLSHQVLSKLGFTNLTVVDYFSNEKNILKLANSDKNILWAAGHQSGLYKVHLLGQEEKVKATMTNKPVASTTLNIAFNKNVDSAIVKKWQDVLNEIKLDGTYQNIVNKYK